MILHRQQHRDSHFSGGGKTNSNANRKRLVRQQQLDQMQSSPLLMISSSTKSEATQDLLCISDSADARANDPATDAMQVNVYYLLLCLRSLAVYC